MVKDFEVSQQVRVWMLCWETGEFYIELVVYVARAQRLKGNYQPSEDS